MHQSENIKIKLITIISNATQKTSPMQDTHTNPKPQGNRIENKVQLEALETRTNQGNRIMQVTNVAVVAINTQSQKSVKLRANSAISVVHGTTSKSRVDLNSLFTRFLKRIMIHKCKIVIRMISLWIVWRAMNL